MKPTSLCSNTIWTYALRCSCFHAVKYASEAMQVTSSTKPEAGGSIVLTASVAGLRSGAGSADYSASKAAVISLAQTGACQLAGTNIRVNAVCPGLIETGMTMPTFEMSRERGSAGKIGQLNPTRRYGVAEEVSRGVGRRRRACTCTLRPRLSNRPFLLSLYDCRSLKSSRSLARTKPPTSMGWRFPSTAVSQPVIPLCRDVCIDPLTGVRQHCRRLYTSLRLRPLVQCSTRKEGLHGIHFCASSARLHGPLSLWGASGAVSTLEQHQRRRRVASRLLPGAPCASIRPSFQTSLTRACSLPDV